MVAFRAPPSTGQRAHGGGFLSPAHQDEAQAYEYKPRCCAGISVKALTDTVTIAHFSVYNLSQIQSRWEDSRAWHSMHEASEGVRNLLSILSPNSGYQPDVG